MGFGRASVTYWAVLFTLPLLCRSTEDMRLLQPQLRTLTLYLKLQQLMVLSLEVSSSFSGVCHASSPHASIWILAIALLGHPDGSKAGCAHYPAAWGAQKPGTAPHQGSLQLAKKNIVPINSSDMLALMSFVLDVLTCNQ